MRAEEIWAQHRDTMFERVALLEQAVATGENAEAARTAAHQLAGTVGTFGFARASALARELERRLDADGATPDLAELVAGVRADLDDPPFVATTVEEPSGLPLVLLVTADAGLAARMRAEATRRGLRLAVADRPGDVPAKISGDRPGAVVLDVPDVPAEALDGVPALVLADAPGPADRTAFAGSEAVALLDRTLPPAELLDEVAVVIQVGAVATQVLVLAPADHPVCAALATAGLDVHRLDGPAELWAAAPAPLVLADGEELCRAL
ncbi:MAG: hypothetical protein QOI80_994, partial [Solirubrobacteraceae bacterium]|nr:hypothetical protein [Solirubrobacteraceae bacterium]